MKGFFGLLAWQFTASSWEGSLTVWCFVRALRYVAGTLPCKTVIRVYARIEVFISDHSVYPLKHNTTQHDWKKQSLFCISEMLPAFLFISISFVFAFFFCSKPPFCAACQYSWEAETIYRLKVKPRKGEREKKRLCSFQNTIAELLPANTSKK